MEELDSLTLEWVTNEGLDPSTGFNVFMDLVKSFGDLNSNLANNKPIKKDIGNCIMFCSGLTGIGLLEVFKIKPKYHNTPMVPQASYYLGKIAESLVSGQNLEEAIANFLHQLEGIAHTRHTSLEESWYISATSKGLIDE